jgi:hypothetical protein
MGAIAANAAAETERAQEGEAKPGMTVEKAEAWSHGGGREAALGGMDDELRELVTSNFDGDYAKAEAELRSTVQMLLDMAQEIETELAEKGEYIDPETGEPVSKDELDELYAQAEQYMFLAERLSGIQ